MNFIKNKKKLELAIKEKSTVNFAKYLSIDTWNKLGFIYNQNKFLIKKAKYGEVSITQNFIYEILKINFENNLSLLEIYESNDEKTNGADIIIAKKFNGKYLEFPFQAKLLTTKKRNIGGSYKHFVHSNNDGKNQQIDLLIESAEKEFKSFLAFYMLYNYLQRVPEFESNETEISHLGISYASAIKIKNDLIIKNFQFEDLHPDYAKAFYHFFIDEEDGGREKGPSPDDKPNLDNKNLSRYSELISFYKKHGLDIDEEFIAANLIFKSAEDIIDPINWTNIGNNYEESTNRKANEKANYFNPRYKIIISGLSNNIDNISFDEVSLTDDDSGGKELPQIEGDFETKVNVEEYEDAYIING